MPLGNAQHAAWRNRPRRMGFNGIILCVLLVSRAGCPLDVPAAEAAEIRIDPSVTTGAGAVLEGKIEAGDFAKVRKYILQGDGTRQIYLASPGGDLNEAMRIGVLLRLLKIGTVVPSKAVTDRNREALAAARGVANLKSDYLCTSACFFVFIAGLFRESDVHGEALLGIHRPTVSAKNHESTSSEQLAAADSNARVVIQNYMKAMDVPVAYTDEMYAVPKNHMRWIRNDEFQRDFEGFIPKLRDLVGALCAARTESEHDSQDGPGQRRGYEKEKEAKCEFSIQDELARGAHRDALKLRDATIPQSGLNGPSP